MNSIRDKVYSPIRFANDLKNNVVTFTKDLIQSISLLLKTHRAIGWFVLLLNFMILFLMTYHLFFGYGRDILYPKDLDESQKARNKWLLLFGDNGFFFIFALIFNVVLMKATMKYVYRTIYTNFGAGTRDSVYTRHLLDKYGIMKWS